MLLLLGPLVIALFVLGCSESEPTATPTTSTQDVEQTTEQDVEGTTEQDVEGTTEQDIERTTETASYRIRLVTGPVVSGPGMSMKDLGHPVNYHLEIHIFDRSTGDVVTNLIPTLGLKGHNTGTTQELPDLMADYHLTDRYFGDNLHLFESKYAVTVTVGNETATFVLNARPSGLSFE